MILESDIIRESDASNSSDNIVIVSEDDVTDTQELLHSLISVEAKVENSELKDLFVKSNVELNLVESVND
jgi:hypothetical protein